MKKNTLKLPNIKMPDLSGLKDVKVNWSRVIAGLSYFHVLAIIPYFVGKKDQFVAYHAKQGIILLGLWILFGFSFYLTTLPYLILLMILICMIIGITNVVKGAKRPLPLIGNIV